jgi:hypothetical protein
MATGSAGTLNWHARTALDAQSFPRLEAATDRQERRLTFRDAEIVANWLNAAKKSSPSSYVRVLKIKQLLEQTRAACARLQNLSAPGQAKAQKKYQIRKAALRSRKVFGGAVRFPGCDPEEYRRLRRTAEGLHSKLNESLARYSLRPRLTYFEFPGLWRAGLVSDGSLREFRMKSALPNNGRFQDISEADAVLLLTRLDQTEKVRLCSGCHARWLAARKSDHQHCSDECREILRAARPDYLPRKRERQREYRRILRERGEA